MGIVRIYVVSRFYAYERMKEFYFGGVHSVGGLSTLSVAGFGPVGSVGPEIMHEQLIYWRLLAGVAGAGILLDFVDLVFPLFLSGWYPNFVDSKFRLCHSESAVRDLRLPLFAKWSAEFWARWRSFVPN